MNVTLDQDANRYVITVDGEQAGFAEIMESDTHVAFTHTEVDKEHEGQGVASALAREALTDAAGRGKRIIPVCGYMAGYLKRHEIPGASVEWPNQPPRE